MAEREFSAGGIVFKKRGKDILILLIKDAYGRWSWPKGKIEQGEQSQEAALREVREEVGLNGIRILDKLGRSNYFYRRRGNLVFKTVFFFLMETVKPKEKLKVQKSEITQAHWFKAKEAKKALTYKGAKEMLEVAIQKHKQWMKEGKAKLDRCSR